MISSNSNHIKRDDPVEVVFNEKGNFYFIRIADNYHNIILNFGDREHLQDIITSLQEQLDEIKEKGE
jgi:DNA-binding LytR/AlgR family response regulator